MRVDHGSLFDPRRNGGERSDFQRSVPNATRGDVFSENPVEHNYARTPFLWIQGWRHTEGRHLTTELRNHLISMRTNNPPVPTVSHVKSG